jgi:hypothetical protein
LTVTIVNGNVAQDEFIIIGTDGFWEHYRGKEDVNYGPDSNLYQNAVDSVHAHLELGNQMGASLRGTQANMARYANRAVACFDIKGHFWYCDLICMQLLENLDAADGDSWGALIMWVQ